MNTGDGTTRGVLGAVLASLLVACAPAALPEPLGEEAPANWRDRALTTDARPGR